MNMKQTIHSRVNPWTDKLNSKAYVYGCIFYVTNKKQFKCKNIRIK